MKIKFKKTNEILDNLYIPKVICFASVLPFYHELNDILNIIYKSYLEHNNSFPLEKLIEQIVLKIPIPLNNEQGIQVLFDSNTKRKNNISRE